MCGYTFGKRHSQMKDIKWLQQYYKNPTSSLQSWDGVLSLISRTKVDKLMTILAFLCMHFGTSLFLFSSF